MSASRGWPRHGPWLADQKAFFCRLVDGSGVTGDVGTGNAELAGGAVTSMIEFSTVAGASWSESPPCPRASKPTDDYGGTQQLRGVRSRWARRSGTRDVDGRAGGDSCRACAVVTSWEDVEAPAAPKGSPSQLER